MDPFRPAPAPPRLEAPELEAILGAVQDRLETATPDLMAVLERGRRGLELELADLLAR
jgi:hypothetical protein